MKTYKASVFGSTGLIGGFLTDILINDPLCEQVVTLTRNELIINNTKHKNHVIDFSNLNEIKKTIKNCDYVYSAIGTTQSRVNYNKKLYRSIDYDITLNIARTLAEGLTKLKICDSLKSCPFIGILENVILTPSGKSILE